MSKLHQQRLKKVSDALAELFADSTVSRSTTLESLEAIEDEITAYKEAIQTTIDEAFEREDR